MKRGSGWPIAITVILGLTVAANVWIAVVAGDDPSFAIEPDYFHKAVTWDSTLAQARKNAQLGWRLESKLAAFDPRLGARLSVTLVDSAGTPISDAIVHVSALYNARANQIFSATLASPVDAQAADYTAQLPVTHAGEWELRFQVVRGGKTFTTTARVEAIAARKT
jgi:hypothetical protein